MPWGLPFAIKKWYLVYIALSSLLPLSQRCVVSRQTHLHSHVSVKILVGHGESGVNEHVKEDEASTVGQEVNTAAVSGDVEIPFVPASQRKPAVTETIEDTIVVVGKAKQKKRKRVKAQEPPDEELKVIEEPAVNESAKRKKTKREVDAPESPEPFDYASAPNILDEPVHEKSDIKPQAKAKGKKGELRDF